MTTLSDTAIREQVEAQLGLYPCTYDFAGIRAFLMGEQVAPAEINPVALFTIFWEEPPAFADSAAQQAFYGAFAQLWQRLGEHTRKKSPFRLVRLEVPTTGTQLEHYLNVRGGEINSLHAGFLQGKDSSELTDEACGLVATLSACSFVVQRLWGEVYVGEEADQLDKDVVNQIKRFESNVNKDVANFVWKAARLQQAGNILR
ncbi:hypothetical protein N1030_15810 [Desulfovibrio mangrovi]|uniref:hypothetical protein n=1 Tax=Desulfovibrio mangrovi TaxID=2976983 RepID=UPI002248360E|nr:hypothetical protein [Desulfovibrio mangrovi]UZP67056.1 hypothetical protein N1030_15810 [Desulfovibrio mangrovi]